MRYLIGIAFIIVLLQPARATDPFAAAGDELKNWEEPLAAEEENEEEIDDATADETEAATPVTAEIGRLLGHGRFTIIDKKNGKVAHITVPVGGSQHFGSLIINLHRCWQEKLRRYNRANKALLEIFNFDNNTAAERQFYGWMFSQEPAMAYLTHARYDVSLAQCIE
jgi:hypothetical protein